MAVIKCKMCGGDLTLMEGQSVAQCEYCGSRQTVPAADDEKKLALFTRANRLRSSCEFDKAAGIYEAIVADFPEEAEAYWGLVLCKYGIEYVDDPATGKKIPTCHRSSFDAVREDNNLDLTLEYADVVARKVYQEEAKQIEALRKDIIEVSSKEPPYDIFICYKETDDNGERTLDSVLAQDLYDALTDRGYRTFFARITLEDKLGQEYEPYIFAALNSAKIMLAVGTAYEYYNAVWVRNEWSRFLKLMEKDKQKHLIPCYKGIDAYDMPKEFIRLQAQDLGKVGGQQDLLRGIDKLLGFSRNGAPVDTKVDTDEISNAVTYRTALDTARRNTIRDLKDAITQLKTISGWKDTDAQIRDLETRLASLRKKKTIKTVLIVAVLLVLVVRGWVWLSTPQPAPTEAPAAAAPPMDNPAAETPAMSDEDKKMAQMLLCGDLGNCVIYAPEGAEELGAFNADLYGSIEVIYEADIEGKFFANPELDLLLQIRWSNSNYGEWYVHTLLHESFGVDPFETLDNTMFGNVNYGAGRPYGYVVVENGQLKFYAQDEKTEYALAAGEGFANLQPLFYGEIKDDGADVWLGLGNGNDTASYKMLSE